VLGAADIARRAVLSAIAASGNSRLVAMASRSPERARAMLAPYPDARVVESYEALLADPEVDVVYNPLPNHLHKEWTLRAFAAGKHVLCEKPVALNATEAEEMAAASKSAEACSIASQMWWAASTPVNWRFSRHASFQPTQAAS